jgi:hypothetical protein
MIDMPVAGFIFSFPRAAYPLGHKWECRQGARLREDWLVPKLRLGNSVWEAPASRLAKLELLDWVPKPELGNQRILNLIAVMQCLGTRKKCVGL